MATAYLDVTKGRRRSPVTEQEWGHPVTRYDLAVERWNALKPSERQARAAECRGRGHAWGELSWGPRVCTRCLTYDAG
jgi:hypothetical protein